MLIPCNIHVASTANDIRQLWAIYTHSDINGVVHYVGVTPLSKLFTLEDATCNSLWTDYFGTPITTLEIKVIALTPNETEAYREQMRQVALHNPICNKKGFYVDVKRQQVKCIETGEVFSSAAEAARMHGLSNSALVNHLNRKSGHRSVKGRTYIRVVA